MQNARYEFSSLYVDVPQPLAEEIIIWGKGRVRDDDLYISDKEPVCGREDQPHVTALYGMHTSDIGLVHDVVRGFGPVHVRLGRVRVFTSKNKYDVVVIDADSDDLACLNALLQTLPHTNRHGGYQPHVTVAYVKQGRGWKHWDLTVWEGREFACASAVFSSKDGSKEPIRL